MGKIIKLNDHTSKPNPPTDDVINDLIDLISKAMTGEEDERRTKIVDDDTESKSAKKTKNVTDINKYKK